MVPNPAFAVWKLTDSQLLSCLTSSLSQSTLPYVLGLRHCFQVWTSLSNRYNSFSRTHVHELRDKMYNLKKTSTMEAYLDSVKDCAQKLEAAGSPMGDDELIFHTLRGLKKGFKGFKTAIRTRGVDLTFDELVTMLKGEDVQMINDDDDDSVLPDTPTITALVAPHQPTSTQPIPGGSTSVNPSSQFNIPVNPPLQFHVPVPQNQPQYIPYQIQP